MAKDKKTPAMKALNQVLRAAGLDKAQRREALAKAPPDAFGVTPDGRITGLDGSGLDGKEFAAPPVTSEQHPRGDVDPAIVTSLLARWRQLRADGASVQAAHFLQRHQRGIEAELGTPPVLQSAALAKAERKAAKVEARTQEDGGMQLLSTHRRLIAEGRTTLAARLLDGNRNAFATALAAEKKRQTDEGDPS